MNKFTGFGKRTLFGSRTALASAAGCSGLLAYLYHQKRQLAFAQSQQFQLISGSTLNPKYDKRYKMGEDALLARPNLLCVLDGVGGWIEVLVDSGTMTKEFIKHIADIADEHSMGSVSEDTNEIALSEIMDEARRRTKAKGSTTCTLAYLTDGQLKTCNLGDSGYLLVRPSRQPGGKFALETLHRSKSQQYYFNCPYQTGIHNRKDPSAEAESLSHDVQGSDLVVLGTDGLWDNLFDVDITNILENRLENRGKGCELTAADLQAASDMISTLAEAKSYDKQYDSPFAVEARAQKKDEPGGKEDDITVIVAQVQRKK